MLKTFCPSKSSRSSIVELLTATLAITSSTVSLQQQAAVETTAAEELKMHVAVEAVALLPLPLRGHRPGRQQLTLARRLVAMLRPEDVAVIIVAILTVHVLAHPQPVQFLCQLQ